MSGYLRDFLLPRATVISALLFKSSLPQPRRLCFHRRLFVCLFVRRIRQELVDQFLFTRFDGKVAHGPKNERSDVGGIPDHVTLGVELGYG